MQEKQNEWEAQQLFSNGMCSSPIQWNTKEETKDSHDDDLMTDVQKVEFLAKKGQRDPIKAEYKKEFLQTKYAGTPMGKLLLKYIDDKLRREMNILSTAEVKKKDSPYLKRDLGDDWLAYQHLPGAF